MDPVRISRFRQVSAHCLLEAWVPCIAFLTLSLLSLSATATSDPSSQSTLFPQHQLHGNSEVLGFPRPPDVITDATPTKANHVPDDNHATDVDAHLLHVSNQPRPAAVSVSTVAILTVLMAAATGLGSLPFFFMDMGERWAGVCNGVACGVMLAASFDLISEGKAHDVGSGGFCVVLGIVLGGLFIVASQKILDQFGDVKMMSLKGAGAHRVLLVLVIMTLHSVGEGSGVGVSFAGPRGLSQGLLVTAAIAVHNVPEGLAMTMVMVARGVRPREAMMWSVFTSLPQPLVAVPAFLGAHTFTEFLPLCMGFAAGCMIWIVMGEVLPECIKEGANSSHVASSATVSVAFMEALGAMLEGMEDTTSLHRLAPIGWSMLVFLGPLLGALLPLFLRHSLPHLLLHSPSLSFLSSPPLLLGLSASTLFCLATYPPLLIAWYGKLPLLPLLTVLYVGCVLHHFAGNMMKNLTWGHHHSSLKSHQQHSNHQQHNNQQQLSSHEQECDRASISASSSSSSPAGPLLNPGLHLSLGARAAILVCLASAVHALAEGLLIGQQMVRTGAAAGMHVLLPAASHGVPRGMAAAAAAIGCLARGSPSSTSSAAAAALAAAALVGLAGPVGALASFAFFHAYGNGLLYCLILSCGFLLPTAFDQVLLLAKRPGGGKGVGAGVLDRRRALVGSVLGLVVVVACLAGKHSLGLDTSYRNAAPEALT